MSLLDQSFPCRILPATSLVGSLDALSQPRRGEPELTPFDFTTIKLSHGESYHSDIHWLSERGQSPASMCSHLLCLKLRLVSGQSQRTIIPTSLPIRVAFITPWGAGGWFREEECVQKTFPGVSVWLSHLCSSKWEHDLAVLWLGLISRSCSHFGY